MCRDAGRVLAGDAERGGAGDLRRDESCFGGGRGFGAACDFGAWRKPAGVSSMRLAP